MSKRFSFQDRPALQLVSNEAGAKSVALNGAMKARLRNQLARAFNHTFGSENGLRVIARLATEQMLRSGNTRAAIRSELTRCVMEHPASAAGRLSLIDGKSRADVLASLLLKWSDRTELA